MQYEWDENKRQANKIKHGVDFDEVRDFQWDGAEVSQDMRLAYIEQRFVAAGFIGHRLHILIFTPRHGKIRIISLRKANNREEQQYEEETSQHIPR